MGQTKNFCNYKSTYSKSIFSSHNPLPKVEGHMIAPKRAFKVINVTTKSQNPVEIPWGKTHLTSKTSHECQSITTCKKQPWIHMYQAILYSIHNPAFKSNK